MVDNLYRGLFALINPNSFTFVSQMWWVFFVVETLTHTACWVALTLPSVWVVSPDEQVVPCVVVYKYV